MTEDRHTRKRDPDARVTLPLDPEDALRALLAVDPDEDPEDGHGEDG